MLHRRQQGGPQILSNNVSKPTVWKRYIDDVFSLWDISKPDIEHPGGHSLIWPIRGRAAGQGMVFGLLCPEQGIQFYANLS